MVFLVLLAQFESLTSALVVMTTVPFGVCAAIYAMLLTGTTINIYSQIGVLMLIGVMAKNGILLVEFANQLRDQGRSVPDAAYEAAQARLRPIAMTTITTVCGLAPLVLIPGEGTELYRGVGAIVLFGLLGTAIVTVTFLPALTATGLRLTERRAASS